MKSEKSTSSFSRAIAILQSFTPNELELSSAEITQKVRLPKSTVYRLVQRLSESRLLEKNPETGKFSIGLALYAIGSLYLATASLLKTAEPVVKTLNDLTGETVNVIIRDKESVLVVMKEESRHAVRYSHHIGSAWPAYASAAGKALLSELTDEEIDILFPNERLQPLTEKTIASKTELKLELERIRKTGVSFNSGGLFEGGEGVGSVIRDAAGKAVAGMSITTPTFRFEQIGREKLATLIRMGASLISYRLGYKSAASPVRDVEEIRSWWKTQS